MNQDTKLSNVTYTLQRQTAEMEEGVVVWRDMSYGVARFDEAEQLLEEAGAGTYRIIQRNCIYVEIQTFVKTEPKPTAPPPWNPTGFTEDQAKDMARKLNRLDRTWSSYPLPDSLTDDDVRDLMRRMNELAPDYLIVKTPREEEDQLNTHYGL